MNAPMISPDYLLRGQDAPTVVHSDEQNEQYIAVLVQLEKKKRPTREEKRLAELLTVLITDYEQRHFNLPGASSIEVLQELMRANELRQKDLLDIFGTESVVSEVLSGKRELNKEHIKRLSARFRVSPELFF